MKIILSMMLVLSVLAPASYAGRDVLVDARVTYNDDGTISIAIDNIAPKVAAGTCTIIAGQSYIAAITQYYEECSEPMVDCNYQMWDLWVCSSGALGISWKIRGRE